jgi:hypothetical protein
MPPRSRPPRAAPPCPRRCPDSSLAPASAVTGPPAHSGTPVNPDSSPRRAAGYPHNPPRARRRYTKADGPANPPALKIPPRAVHAHGAGPASRGSGSRLPASALEGCTSQQGANRSWHRQRSRAHDEHTKIRRRTDHSRPRPRSGGPGSTPRPPRAGCGPWSQVPQPRHPPGHCVPRCAGPHPAVRTRQPGAARAGARTSRRGFAPVPKPNADRHGGGGVLSAQCPHRARPGGI